MTRAVSVTAGCVLLQDKKTEAMLLVGPHSGISIVTNIKSYSVS